MYELCFVEHIHQILARSVRRLRLQLAISQEELGSRADLDRTYVNGLEAGRRNPTVSTLARIARALGVSPAALLTDQPGIDSAGGK